MEERIMEKNRNLENLKSEQEDVEVEDVTEVLEQEATEVDESDLSSPMFDDEGNLIDDDEENDSQEQPDREEDQLEDDQQLADNKVQKQPNAAKKKLSPAEVAIIELKRENKLKEKRLHDLEQKIQEQAQVKEQESGIAKYIAEGHDEETAKRYYADDQRYQQLNERTEVLDFRDEHEDVFARYPQARSNVKQIMKVVKSGLMTAEQACKGLYGNPTNDRESRAALAAKGESLGNVNSNNLSRQDRSGMGVDQSGLTAEQRKEKTQLERLFKLQKPLTVQEYLKVSKL